MKRTLLIVDDVGINREILKKILGDEYGILEAGDGEEAIAAMRAGIKTISAVLLDLVMPVMDGFEMLARIRADAELCHIPVIVTTGQTEEASEVKALALGANDYITKPYNSTIIKQRIRNTINLRETAATINSLQRDRLTGLYSREFFFEKARELIDGHPAGYYTIVSFNINGFKVINDQYGTEKGDLVLRHMATCFDRAMTLLGGMCCRMMADCFAVIYPTEYIVSDVMSRCREEAARPPCLDRPVSLRIGRYTIVDLSISVSAMFDRAAIAEDSIKGRYDVMDVQYDESMRQSILKEQEIVNEMRQALAEGQFEPWFQPQFNHASGALIGAEALARWRHPRKGLIPPGDFIPVFERNGFVYELDKHIWEQTCRYLKKWRDEGLTPLPVSVNVSRYDILQDDVVSVIVSLLARYALPAELLRLEITESAFAGAGDLIIDRVETLVNKGLSVEIDDFGSGYSSLNTLKDVPASILKLDMRFLESGRNSQRGGNILESIVRMAKWLGMPVIAEGVETVRQADFLKSIGCCYIQGYLYARPMPAAEYERFCREYGDAHGKERDMHALETVDNLDSDTFWDPGSLETLIFNSYVGGACIYEARDGRTELLRVNDHYVREIGAEGLAGAGIQALDLFACLDEKNAAMMRACVDKAVSAGGETSCEVALQIAPGRDARTFLRLTMRTLARTGSRCIIYCTVFNITALRTAEREVKNAYEQMRMMMDDIPGGFCQMQVTPNRDVRILYINDGFCRMVGMTRERVMAVYGQDALSGVYPEDRMAVRHTFRMDTSPKGEIQIKCRLTHGEKDYIWVMLFGRVIKLESGEVRVNAYYTDVTQQTRREEQSRALLPLILSAVMASTSDLSFAKDSEYRYLCASRAFVRLVGRESERELIGKTDYDLFDKETADKYRSDDVRLMKQGESIVDLLEAIPSDDGVQHYSSTSKYLLRDAGGNVIGLYGVGRDVTEYHTAFERLKMLTESIPGGIAAFEATPDAVRCTYFNEGYFSFSGYTKEEYQKLIDKNPFALFAPKDARTMWDGAQAIRRGERETMELTCPCMKKDGGVRWLKVKAVGAERKGDGRLINAVRFDVTEDKLREEKLRMSEEQCRMAMRQSGNIMCRYDVADLSVNMSPETAVFFGMPQKTLNVPYAPIRQGNIAPHSAAAYTDFYEGILRGQATGAAEFECKTVEGWRWMKAIQSTVFSDDGRPVYAVISLEDSTEQRHQEKERAALLEEQRILRRKADIDGLTGVYNKAVTESKIAERLAVPGKGLRLLMIVDIDDLKSINDTYGHPQGDKAICAVADVLDNRARSGDVVGRVGGDEFIVYMEGLQSREKAEELLAELLRRARAVHLNDGVGCSPYISIGATVTENAPNRFETLYAQADAALYQAKRGGKRQYALYTPGMESMMNGKEG